MSNSCLLHLKGELVDIGSYHELISRGTQFSNLLPPSTELTEDQTKENSDVPLDEINKVLISTLCFYVFAFEKYLTLQLIINNLINRIDHATTI